jgi:cytochrome P450 family 138
MTPVHVPSSAPPGPRLPKLAAGIAFLAMREPMTRRFRRQYGDAFTVNLPTFGRTVVVSSPDLVKQVFQAKPDVLAFGVRSPLGEVLGPGSLFSMDGDQHLRERRLILPPFHGERMKSYEGIVEEETLREIDTWPIGREFATLRSFMAITLNVILRAVFGAGGGETRQLAGLLPKLVARASLLSLAPMLRRDLGPGSPGRQFSQLRARYDAIIDAMIDARRVDPDADARDDVLSMLLRAQYHDGASMSRSAIADELLTLLAAGHETTATSLAWTVERLRRHPLVLERLATEAQGESNELRIATILEVQRTRPVIIGTGRHAMEDFPLGEFVVPKGYHLFVVATSIHSDERFFESAKRFDPERFLAGKPDAYTWIPFGGGTRRCPGAAFAHMEMDIVIRTLLRTFELQGTFDPDEGWRNRGVAFAPRRGGRAVVRRVGAPFVQAAGAPRRQATVSPHAA